MEASEAILETTETAPDQEAAPEYGGARLVSGGILVGSKLIPTAPVLDRVWGIRVLESC